MIGGDPLRMKSGQVIAGKYRLSQPLGSGGMAEVWSATNTFTDRQIAIKFLNREVAKTPEAAARFLKEAKVSARINHPNIIDIHDVGQTEDGQLFLVMELLTGFPLEVALRRQTPPMSLYELAIVMVEVADALSAAHKSGIVHRDLKPTNIFLHEVKEGVAITKLLDFGVSKFLEDDQNHALTVAGTVLGSPLYMSPEQARGEASIDGRTDIFAFGAILFEALCGFRAYDARNFNALIVKIATTPPKRIDEHADYVPASLRAIVRGCLEADPKKRFQSFEQVTPLLRASMQELEASGLRLPTPTIASALVDPDATNALPVMKASDRPPPPMVPSTPPPGSIPPPRFPSSPSWHSTTPNTSYASITVSKPRAKSSAPLFAGLAVGAAILFGVALTGTVLVARGRSHPHPVAAVPPPPAPALTAEEPKGMSIGDLPTAPPRAGRLVVTASSGVCAVIVDGKERGPTPVAAFELPAGNHPITCRLPSGKLRTGTVTIQEGATSKYRFALED